MRCNYECKDDEDTLTGEQTNRYHWEANTVYYRYCDKDNITRNKKNAYYL